MQTLMAAIVKRSNEKVIVYGTVRTGTSRVMHLTVNRGGQYEVIYYVDLRFDHFCHSIDEAHEWLGKIG